MNYKGIVPLPDKPRTHKEYLELYRATEHARELNRNYTRVWSMRNPEKRKSQKAATYARRAQRQKACCHDFMVTDKYVDGVALTYYVCPKCNKKLSVQQYKRYMEKNHTVKYACVCKLPGGEEYQVILPYVYPSRTPWTRMVSKGMDLVAKVYPNADLTYSEYSIELLDNGAIT